MSRGLLLLVSGPAGSGKTTLCERLTAAHPDRIRRVVTCTTRAPRTGEKQGVDYHFLSVNEFESQVSSGVFLEHAYVHGNFYGLRATDVFSQLTAGLDVLVNLDIQGAATLRNKARTDGRLANNLVTVFVRVLDPVELRRRLSGRGTDPTDEIERRMRVATEELRHACEYDHIIESGTRDADFAALDELYQSARRTRA